MNRNINELIYGSEAELWKVLDAATGILDRRAAPYAWVSEAYNAGAEVIIHRRDELTKACEELQVSTDVIQQVSCAWLAQLRAEFLEAHRQRNALFAATQWQPMDTAPVDRRIMLRRPRWHGGDRATLTTSFGRWEAQPYHKTPRPYWADEQSIYSVAQNRESVPVGWREIPQ